jgi:hypothetical protein
VRENVTTSYRGANYEIGRGDHFYGIWAAGAPRSLPPLEWWPETAEGWSAAWSRFTAIEAPSSIIHAAGPGAWGQAPGPGWGAGTPAPGQGTTPAPGQGTTPAPGAGPTPAFGPGPATPAHGPGTATPAAGWRTGVIAWALLFLGVICGVIGLFPSYLGGSSLASQASDLVPHLFYLAGWTAGAVLIVRGGARMQAGALIAGGVSAITLGLFLADVGQRISGTAAGAGVWQGLIGWVACTAGAVYGWRISRAGAPARPHKRELGPIVLVLLAGIGTAVAFAPSWDSYLLRNSAGATATVTAGNAFANPGAVIAGNVITMAALILVVAAAALWRPVRHGGLLIAGALIPLVAQAISALIQLGQTTAPELFGISPAQAAQESLTVSNGLTPAFWIYCVFVVALAAACGWMFLAPDARSQEPHIGGPVFPAGWWDPGMAGPMATPGVPATNEGAPAGAPASAAPASAAQPAATGEGAAEAADLAATGDDSPDLAVAEPAGSDPAVSDAVSDSAVSEPAASEPAVSELASPGSPASPPAAATEDAPSAGGEPRPGAEEGETGGSAD